MAFAVILVLYVTIGLLSAAGSVWLSQKTVPARWESAVFGLLLIAIACFYVAFTSYFADERAWSLELTGVAAFVVLGGLGIRAPAVLIAGYGLHGVWDLLHEVHAHSGADTFGGRVPSEIPLAYGAFCATYDCCMAAYFYMRRSEWRAAWMSRGA
jgi:hypothetical protein